MNSISLNTTNNITGFQTQKNSEENKVPIKMQDLPSDKVCLSQIEREEDTDEIGEKNILKIISWWALGGVTALTLSFVGFLALRKGASSTWFKKMNEAIKQIDDKPKEYGGFKFTAASISKPFIDLGEKISSFIEPICNNPVAFRDNSLDKACKKLKLDTLVDGLQKWFKNIAISSIESKYHKVDKKFTKTYLEIQNTINKLNDENSQKDKLIKQLEELKKLYDDDFSMTQRQKRYSEVWLNFKDTGKIIDDYLWKEGTCFSKEKRKNLKEYITFNLPGIKEKLTEKQDKITNVTKKIVEKMDDLINEINKIPKIESNKLEKVKNKTKHSLLNATQMEKEDLYKKFLELKVGSATSDILFYIFPAAWLGYELCSSKDKDEMISKTITTGVPLLGGLGVTFISMARLDNALKSLLIGSMSGLALDFVARSTNREVMKIKEKQKLNQTALDYYHKNYNPVDKVSNNSSIKDSEV